MKDKKMNSVVVAMLCMAALLGPARADGPDALYFVTGGSLDSTAILSVTAGSPTTVFAGANLAEYEPTYAYFNRHNPGGDKWYVREEIEQEIMRPYNVVRTGSGSTAAMTVQFQGVARRIAAPHTFSVTIRFIQDGADVKAYVVRAAALKALDVELGLDIDALVDADDARAEAVPLTGESKYNVSVISFRKPGAAAGYALNEGDSVVGEIGTNADVAVSHAARDTAEYDGYLDPDAGWVAVAPDRSLADLDAVEGTFHVHFDGKKNIPQTAYNLKYTTVSDRLGQKTCQFQYERSDMVACVLVQFRQNGDDVEMFINKWRGYWIAKDGHEDEVAIGMDFEKYDGTTTPKRNGYSAIGMSDDAGNLGVKDLTLKFRSRAATAGAGYLVDSTWTTVATNQSLANLVQVDGFFHTGNGKGQFQTAEQLHAAPGDIAAEGVGMTCQFQYFSGNFIKGLRLRLKQVGSDVQAYANRYSAWYMWTTNGAGEVVYADDVRLGMDMEQYSPSTVPVRYTYGGAAIADSDSSTSNTGVRDLRLIFNSTGAVYAASHTSLAGGTLSFEGAESNPVAARTTAATTFPSNGVVRVGPYAELTLAGHTSLDRLTKYRVEQNGTLRLGAAWQTSEADEIELAGGVLSSREGEQGAAASGTYVNYLTLMDGARVRGRPVMVQHDAAAANWMVAGRAPSYCDSGIVLTASGGDGEQTFRFNVNDATGDGDADFEVSGDIIDYGSFFGADEYWNTHVVKAGAGTMQVSGTVTLPNEFAVEEGALRLAGTNTFAVSRAREATGAKGEIWLNGGRLETAENATNTTGRVVVKYSDAYAADGMMARLDLGDGSALTIESLTLENNMKLLVSTNLARTAALRVLDLPESVRSRIRCIEGENEKRVKVGPDGWLKPYVRGFGLFVK